MSSTDLLPKNTADFESQLELNRAKGWPDLTNQAKEFLGLFASGLDFRDCCTKAGLTRPEGSALINHRLGGAYVDDMRLGMEDRSIITRQMVEIEILKQYEKASGEVDVPNVTKDGDVVWAPRFNGAATVALLKEMKGITGGDQSHDSKGVTVNLNFSDFTGRQPVIEGVVVEPNSSE